MPLLKNLINSKLTFSRIIIDFLIIFALCLIFSFSKAFYFTSGPDNWNSFLNGILVISFASTIICYPAFLIGIRIKKSVPLFCILSWLTNVIVYFLILNWGQGLSYNINSMVVKNSGDLTLFGFFYEIILTPHALMALWATWLMIHAHCKR